MDHQLIFETLHGLRFAMMLGLFALFGRYVFVHRKNEIDAATAFLLYCAGEGAWRGLVWINRGDDASSLQWWVPFMVAGSVSLVGAILCFRSLLPSDWTWPAWALLLFMAALITAITLLS